METFKDLVAAVKDAAMRGGRGSDFMRAMVLSYAGGKPLELSEFDHLDDRNRALFWQFLHLRKLQDWSNSGLSDLVYSLSESD